MCRLLYVPAQEKTLPARSWATVSKQLRTSMGGDGAGVWTRAGLVRGVKLSDSAIAKLLVSAPAGEALVHHRKATAGGVNDALCHPFPAGDDRWVAHNGVWDAGSRLARAGESESDTSIMSEMIARWGVRALELLRDDFAGVWLTRDKLGCKLWYSSGNFGVGILSNGVVYFASEPLRFKHKQEWRPLRGWGTPLEKWTAVALKDIPEEPRATHLRYRPRASTMEMWGWPRKNGGADGLS